MRGGPRKGAGRPPGPTGTAKDDFIQVRIDSQSKEEFEKWCTKQKIDMSEFLRDVISEAAVVRQYIKELRAQEQQRIKTESQIREEIEAAKRTISNYRNAYKKKEISLDVLKSNLIDNEATIAALRWVLGENDRYD